MKGANPFIGLTRGQVAAALARWAGTRRTTAGRRREGNHEDDAVADRCAGRFIDVVVAREGQAVCRPGVARTGVGEAGGVVPRHPQGRARERRRASTSTTRARTEHGSRVMQVTRPPRRRTALLTNPVALRRRGRTRGDARSSTAHDTWRGTAPQRRIAEPGRHPTVRGRRDDGDHARARSCIAPTCSSCCSTRRRRRRSAPDRRSIIPPQVNKYYFLDLAPGRSFVEHAVSSGACRCS